MDTTLKTLTDLMADDRVMIIIVWLALAVQISVAYMTAILRNRYSHLCTLERAQGEERSDNDKLSDWLLYLSMTTTLALASAASRVAYRHGFYAHSGPGSTYSVTAANRSAVSRRLQIYASLLIGGYQVYCAWKVYGIVNNFKEINYSNEQRQEEAHCEYQLWQIVFAIAMLSTFYFGQVLTDLVVTENKLHSELVGPSSGVTGFQYSF